MSLADNATESNEKLNQYRKGKLELGLDLGIPSIDRHLRYKKGQFNIINGHDNVGKTDWMLYYMLLLTLKYGKKWVVCSNENQVYSLKLRLVQWLAGKDIRTLENTEYQANLTYIEMHFNFMSNKETMSFKDILKYLQHERELDFDGCLIDPYNSLVPDKGVNRHEFDYEVCRELRVFCAKFEKTIYLNTHCATEATRRTYPQDHQYALHLRPPNKADVEGGQKFANRADDFLTIHRMTQHPDRNTITEIHVRKVKDTLTGGRPTMLDSPLEFTYVSPFEYNVNGLNPVLVAQGKQTESSEYQQKELTGNTFFDDV